MGVLRDFRRAADALERISVELSVAAVNRAETGPLLERLVALEQGRAMWEAEVEGILAKAEGKLKAAANSEARERTMQKSRGADLDPFDFDSEEEPEILPVRYAEAGEEEEVQAVRVDVAPDYKALALNRKFS